uniref:Uncharacterized protein n=1 Tax=Arundo donax TaxID=35708 RepID=A0A0A9FL62_ARUDO
MCTPLSSIYPNDLYLLIVWSLVPSK